MQRDKLIVIAALDDLAVFENANHVGVADGGKTVSDDKDGATLHELVHTLLDEFLGASVDGRCCLVENENGGICDCGSCDCKELTLTLRKVFAVTGEHGVVAFGQVADEIVRIGEFRSGDDFFIGGIEFAKANVVGNRTREQVRVLQHHCHRATQIVLVDLGDVDVVVSYLALIYVIEAVDKVGDCGFTCAG